MTSPELDGVNLLEIVPVRLAEWEESGDRVVLVRPLPATRGFKGWLERLGFLMSARRIRLDAAGSLAWRLLDGRRTVGEVAERLRRELGKPVEPAEERLGRLVRQLRRDGFLAYPEWDAAVAGTSRPR